MRHAIARAIFACLHILLTLALPAKGRRRKPPTAAAPVPPPPYVSPWSRPWTGPTKEEAAEFFRRQAEADTARERELQQERQRAAAYATLGIDYPYTYPGAPFPAEAFRTSA
ncbi:hypothetical protein PV682_43775 [Streptomyces niveiscabiei]|uniref:hypothetical protein n=1 Tax=Streptomyces niveiscabiei TaxID=164115 RepID=UPI0029AB9944|nr:hypothetical protein [Streptomyces niveiscabiei]MDX3388309.1 hypothetical protein [Streptomyces niveiscabiei]